MLFSYLFQNEKFQTMEIEVNPWITEDTEIKYSNNWIDLRHNKVKNPAGKDGIYGVVHFKNIAAAIIPLDKDLNTYLVGQYRYPLDIYSWELPMGGNPLNDNLLEGAKRELLEETGLIAQNWTEIGRIHTSNCVTDEEGIVYLAEELSQEMAIPEETERLTIKKLPFKKVVEMAMNGEITDAISLFGILKLARILKI
jgi:ADP-ribose pyrophosphatase